MLAFRSVLTSVKARFSSGSARLSLRSALEGGGAEEVEGAGGVGVDVAEAAVVDDDRVEVPEVEGGQVAGGDLLDADVVGDLLFVVVVEVASAMRRSISGLE